MIHINGIFLIDPIVQETSFFQKGHMTKSVNVHDFDLIYQEMVANEAGTGIHEFTKQFGKLFKRLEQLSVEELMEIYEYIKISHVDEGEHLTPRTIQEDEQELIFSLLTKEQTKNKLLKTIEQLIENKKVVDDAVKYLGQTFFQPLLDRKWGISNQPNDFTRMDQTFEKVQQLLNHATISYQANEKEKLTKIATNLLEIFKEWNVTREQMALNQAHGEEDAADSKVNRILNELFTNYQRRISMDANHFYRTNAKITVTDVEQWLTHALEKYEEIRVPRSERLIMESPVSNIDRYLIHIHEGVYHERADQQLLEQFQQIIRTSQFLSNPRLNQLSFTLKPEYLGEMVVHLVEVDGEMTLKILVSSKVTKQMLESNLHELRNLFSPHQVVIEEQRGENIQDQQFLTKDDEAFKEEENNPHHNEENNEQNKRDFEEELERLRISEKV